MTYRGIGGTEELVPSTYQIEIGPDLKLGASKGNQPEPGPRRVSWKKKNRVNVHEIPGFKDKTQRSSVETLWTLSITTRTLLQETRDIIKRLIKEVGPHLVFEPTMGLMQMYITDAEAMRVEGEDEPVIEWTLTLLETND
jgi:hypothetical protein